MARGIKGRSRIEGTGKPNGNGKPNGTGVRSRSRTPVTPAQVRHRIRTEGSGQTPTRTVPGSALSQTGDVRSRSRTETPVSARLRGRSRTEGAAPGPTNVQIAKALSDILRLLGQQPRKTNQTTP